MKRNTNGLIRLETILMASIAAAALAVCVAPFFETTETWGVASAQFVRMTPIEEEPTQPEPPAPGDSGVAVTARAVADSLPTATETSCICISPRQQAMERLRRQRNCGADAKPSCS